MGRSSRYLGGMAAVAATGGDAGARLGARRRPVHQRGDRRRDHRRLGDRLGSRRPPGHGEGPGRHGCRVPERGQAADPSGDRRQRQHGPDQVRRAAAPTRTYHYRFCIPGGSPCSADGQVPDRPASHRPARRSGSPTRATRRASQRPGQTNAVLGELQGLPVDGGREQRLQHRLRRHDLLRPGGSRARPPLSRCSRSGPCTGRSSRSRTCSGIRSATGLYNHWDDHEFINDFSIPENGRPLYDRSVRAFRNYDAGHLQQRARHLPELPLGQEPASSSSSTSARSEARKASANGTLRQPGHRPAGPGADGAAEHPQLLLGARSLARPARLAGLQEQDQQPEPHLPRQARSSTGSSTTSRARRRSGRWS